MPFNQPDGSTQVGAGTTISCEQGAMLTPSAGAITVTDSFHTIDGGTLSTINGGVANSLYVFEANSTVTISATTNITTSRSTIPTGTIAAFWFDGTTFADLATVINSSTGTGAVVLQNAPTFTGVPLASGGFKVANAAGLITPNGAASDVVGLIFADQSDLVHLAYYGASGMVVPTPNSAFGRAAMNISHVIVYVGAGQNAAPGTYDLTSADGAGALVGLACYPVMRLTANDTDHYGAKFWADSIDDGNARTLTNQYGVYVLEGNRDTHTTITNQYGVYIVEPTKGTNNYGLYNGGKSYLLKNVGIGAAPSATYTLWIHSATNSNLGIIDSTGATGGAGTFLSSLNDSGGTIPTYYSASLHTFMNGTVKIGVSGTPQAIAIPPVNVTLANGANSNIPISGAGFIRIVGPTGAFSTDGFVAGIDGQQLDVLNTVAQQWTITNQATSSAANQINTLRGADVVQRSGTSFGSFIYDGATSKWILRSAN